VLLCADVMAEGAFPAALRCGIEYAPVALLALRVGTESETGSFSCGIGVRASIVALDYAFRRHPELGATHALSLGVALPGGAGEDR
jgi:hypothetical protein